MSNEKLTLQALALPLSDRVRLAQELWDSIEPEQPLTSDQSVVQEAQQRATELAQNPEAGKSHEDAMRDLRRRLRCG